MKTKSIILSGIVTLVAALCASLAFAQSSAPPQGRVLQGANLRSGPGTDFPVVGSAQVGQSLTISGCNEACDWYQLASGEWIAAFLVEPGILPTTTAASLLPTITPAPLPSVSITATATLTPTARPAVPPASKPVVVSPANLRAGPGTTFAIIGSASAGQAVEVVGQTEAGDWYLLANGSWIAAFLVSDASAAPIVAPPTAAAPATVPTATPTAETPDSPATATPALEIAYINMHYECEQRLLDYEGTPGLVVQLWGYRSFQVDMYITNRGTEPVTPPWKPKRWILTDGAQEFTNDLMWQWVHGDLGAYAQPTIFPGQTVGWTFVAFPIDEHEWVKAVEFVWQDQTYRQEFDLGPFGNAYNYRDCGVRRQQKSTDNPTPTPRP